MSDDEWHATPPRIKIVPGAGHRGRAFFFTRMQRFENGRPVGEPRWIGEPKHHKSQKYRRYIEAQLQANPDFSEITPPGSPVPQPVEYDGRGRPVRVVLPGLTLRWEKVTKILETLASNFPDADTLRLTVDELRGRVR